jgi:hypothetical protein
MLIDVHSHYMPAELGRALEKRVEAPRIFKRDGQSLEYRNAARVFGIHIPAREIG